MRYRHFNRDKGRGRDSDIIIKSEAFIYVAARCFEAVVKGCQLPRVIARTWSASERSLKRNSSKSLMASVRTVMSMGRTCGPVWKMAVLMSDVESLTPTTVRSTLRRRGTT
ncbi:hypothetical protein AMELA_G00067690 [Ameiurus melas]|uniref:Uncharacterized protein n=1 Tax=Ameiurus melas TaxID=219545 RepID=A0A7J6B790_AMEME|nr:hypothetical protein AMELA_G00067690 [Ameiurus melas]